jgi:hypothetical protein
MKRIISFHTVFFAMSLFLTVAQADTGPTTLNLGSSMKQIGILVKSISTSINDSSKNSDSASSAEQLVTLFASVQTQVPDFITSLPADQQEAAIADFKSMIQQEIDLSQALDKAFQTNDNAGAALILNKMQELKHQGHSKYNPD